ncbi:hypothetical protein ZIOFF_051914 [Zingiber officinale]|uniref:CNNM transmembrane domain-containing protein n=1 Tax=Zingiber officinale TaxID=94328 RepID=A0A8J5KSL5_ZINOF|nr:hypothetical protein ZIOFF_051914 [Zingiber officinale]
MHAINAMVAARMLTTVASSAVNDGAVMLKGEDIPFGSFMWYAYAGISCFLVLFAGIMSGLTLGLMSLGLVELEILQRSGTPIEKKQAATILPVVQKQHQLLVTLLLCNAAAMEALPLYLDRIFNPFVAIVLSVTFVLAFGEVIPQAICTRYGLAVGANLVWLVRILMIMCYPIAYPVGKILDCALGHNESALFRRAQLKALVSIHSKEAGKGGELTHDETTIISGALDLTEKVYAELPFFKQEIKLMQDWLVFASEFEITERHGGPSWLTAFQTSGFSRFTAWEAIGKILARGHSRVPVYSGNPKNIIGLLLVKSLLTVRPETETPVSAISIRRIPRVPADMPLYDILNEFQKGSSHMAAVVKSKGKPKSMSLTDGEKSGENKELNIESNATTPLLSKTKENLDSVVVDVDRYENKLISEDKPTTLQQNDAEAKVVSRLSEDTEEGEVIGIITLEDVFEELLQEEIVDETDEYVDVHKRIRVAAAAAASSVARAPSYRRLTKQKSAGALSRQGQQPAGILKKPTEGDLHTPRHQVNLVEPLLGTKR